MTDYDVIVIGGGPGGSSAARTASELGARTVLLEEHRAIGLPRHCAGRLQGSSFTPDIVKRVSPRVIVAECKARRYFGPRGNLVLETPIPPGGGYMVLREEFDRELARLAARAGAEVLLNARATGLLRENGRVAGVTTASQSHPLIRGRLVISAEGSKGRQAGTGAQEGMSRPGESFEAGVLIELQNVRGLERGVPEVHLGALAAAGFARVWTQDDNSCFVTGPSLEAIERMRRSSYLYGKKTGDARTIQVHGSAFGDKSGQQLPKLVKDGFMVVGDAAGYTSMMHAIVSGRFAAEVGVAALKDGDVTEKRLAPYQRRCEDLGLHLTGLSWKSLVQLKGRSDAEVEAMLPGMLACGEVLYADPLPF